jgi:transposase
LDAAGERGLIEPCPEAAIDATGLETRHISRHFESRRANSRPFIHHVWPKLTLVVLTRSHLIVGATTGEGPSQDSPDFAPAMDMACSMIALDRVLGDCGYDGEHNHRLCRETHGVRSTVIKLNPRTGLKKRPKGKYRAQMWRCFHYRVYGQRWQIESAISRNKRILGTALRARRRDTQSRECLLRTLVHNLMILRLAS